MSNGDFIRDQFDNELYHYGVPGMRWGKRKARIYESKATNSRLSAKEWNEIGQHKYKKLTSAGKIEKANKVKAKYDEYAKKDRSDAKQYSQKLKTEQAKNKFRESRGNAYKSRSKGAKLATNLLAGPFANRTYNSVIAAGGTKNGARIVTALVGVGGPLAHLAVSALYTEAAGSKRTYK